MRIEEALGEWVAQAGPFALPTLFLAALIEYVFPPFPGDSVTLLGAFVAVQGELPLTWVFLAVTAGSVAGAAIDYRIGARIGRAAERRSTEGQGRFAAASYERLRRIEAAYRRHGDLYILANRFLPGVRGFFFVAAGMAGMSFRRVMALGAISASVWNLLLLAAGWAVGENFDRLVHLFRTYSSIAWTLIALVVAGWLALQAYRWFSRRRSRAPSGDGGVHDS